MSIISSTTGISREVSMDIDVDTSSQSRKYPSIRDYYRASSHEPEKPIQLQHGLSNYSNLVLGDDRIAVGESILSATYRVAVEDKMAITSPSKSKTKHSRRREYQEAVGKVGDIEINRLEKVMKDKLIQRSHITSSPFHVRKAFKFFDRENCMRIHIEGFTRALEFLGFQFSEMQNMALFAKYDKEFSGEIDYMYFIQTAMFYQPTEVPMPTVRIKPGSQKSGGDEDLYQVPDVDENELRLLQEAELRRVFNKVDLSRSGSINADQFELLLMAMGHNVSAAQLDAYCTDIGLTSDSQLAFSVFHEWWTSDVGAGLVPTKKESRK